MWEGVLVRNGAFCTSDRSTQEAVTLIGDLVKGSLSAADGVVVRSVFNEYIERVKVLCVEGD